MAALQTYKDGFSNESSTKSTKDSKKHANFARINETLITLSNQIRNENENIRRAENSLGVRSSVTQLSSDFANRRKEAEGLEGAVSERSSKISAMGDQLSILEEKLEEMQENFESKSGNGEDGNTASATKFRSAIKKIKDDCTQLSLNIGLTEALLANKRATQSKHYHAERSRKHAEKKKNRRNTPSAKESNYYDALDI